MVHITCQQLKALAVCYVPLSPWNHHTAKASGCWQVNPSHLQFNKMDYPEIERLKALQEKHGISIRQLPSEEEDFILVELRTETLIFQIFVDDEYKDFDENKPLMCLFLALQSLEDYADSDDYLVWCRQNGLNSSDLKWLDYYKALGEAYDALLKKFGEIDTYINSLDYQLRSGAFWALSQL